MSRRNRDKATYERSEYVGIKEFRKFNNLYEVLKVQTSMA